METWLLLDKHNNILDKCLASSKAEADTHFNTEGWMTGEAISEADFMSEYELNKLENQSPE